MACKRMKPTYIRIDQSSISFKCFILGFPNIRMMDVPEDESGRKINGNWRMEWVASTLHTTSEHGVSSITTADAHTSAASSRLN